MIGLLWLVSDYGWNVSAPDRSDDRTGSDAYDVPSTPSLEELGGLVGEATGSQSMGEADAQVAERVTDALGDLGDYSSERRAGELPDVAADVLEAYRAQGVELVFADYLGVLDDTWACLVKGDRWVEICVVRDGGTDGTSKVETVHFDADRFAEALPDELFEPGGVESALSELDALIDAGGEAHASPEDEGAER